MSTQESSFAAARERVKDALAALSSGDPQPYMGCWADSTDVTLFGAWGPIERGHRRLVETFGWVGSRFSDGQLIPEDVVVSEWGAADGDQETGWVGRSGYLGATSALNALETCFMMVPHV